MATVSKQICILGYLAVTIANTSEWAPSIPLLQLNSWQLLCCGIVGTDKYCIHKFSMIVGQLAGWVSSDCG